MGVRLLGGGRLALRIPCAVEFAVVGGKPLPGNLQSFAVELWCDALGCRLQGVP